VWQATGQRPKELDGPSLPESLDYIWRWFIDLHNGRGSSGFGPAALTWPDIGWYFQLHGIRPLSFELDLIKRLDMVAIKAAVPDKAPAAPRQGKKR